MTESTTEIADALDALAGAAARIRRLAPGMSIEQRAVIAAVSPWDGDSLEVLIQLDTWAVIAAAELRGVLDLARLELGA